MNEMIERVARALNEASGGEPFDALRPGVQDAMRKIARAGVQAMREPDAEMVERGYVLLDNDGALPSDDTSTRCWQAMVDVILADGDAGHGEVG